MANKFVFLYRMYIIFCQHETNRIKILAEDTKIIASCFHLKFDESGELFKQTSTSCALITLNMRLASDLKTILKTKYLHSVQLIILKLIRNVPEDWNYSMDKKIAKVFNTVLSFYYKKQWHHIRTEWCYPLVKGTTESKLDGSVPFYNSFVDIFYD